MKENICMITLRKRLIHETCLLQIALRNMKSIEVRAVGSVEPLNIDISVVSVTQHYVIEKAIETFFLNDFAKLLVTLQA